MILLPAGLNALKKVAKKVDLPLRGAYLKLDAGVASTYNRQCIFNAGMIPTIKETPATASVQSAGGSDYSTPLFMP